MAGLTGRRDRRRTPRSRWAGNTGVRHARRLATRLAPRAWPRRNMAKSGAANHPPAVPLQELEEAVAQQARAGAGATDAEAFRRLRSTAPSAGVPFSSPCVLCGGGGSRGYRAWGRGLPAACRRDRRRWSGWARRGCLDCRCRRPHGAGARMGRRCGRGGRGRGRRNNPAAAKATAAVAPTSPAQIDSDSDLPTAYNEESSISMVFQ